jgi:hypothetical protein
MALNAQAIADNLAKAGMSGANALTALDQQFSQWYVGERITSLAVVPDFLHQSGSHALGTSGSTLKHSLPESYFGPGGFPQKFSDRDSTQDQTHHFAAYFSAGLNSAEGTAKTHLLTDLIPGNTGDVNLGRVGYSLGSYLRNNPGRLKDIGALINTNVCLGKGGR